MPKFKLTTKEFIVLQLTANGQTLKEIAYSEGLHRNSITDRVQRIRKKLGAETLAHALAIAMRNGIIH
jgi:two-component system, NarL family, response regulator YdfI